MHRVGLIGEDRGVVDEYVDLAEALQRTLHQNPHRVLVAYVGRDRERRIAPVLCRDGVERFCAVDDIGDHDLRAGRRQRLAIMPSDSDCAARHDRGAARKSAHARSCVRPCTV